ncbi:transmembrane protein 138-like [Paramacrobiotus metropolitanus]|uniref:transmembrane protein 138-like n=1 Tax=Paramacrobiotus metropolitanus TaxID=2943436 RepID=UPI002445FBC9|nr:transmembrane protein 138-like [Paramacrobiotus metropolitanus]
MAASGHGFRIFAFFQHVLLLADLTFNIIVGLFMETTQIQVSLYIVQDVCLVLAAAIFCIQIFSFFYGRNGGPRPTLISYVAIAPFWTGYFGLCLGVHIWAINQWYQSDTTFMFIVGYRALYTVQRCFSYLYYYVYYRKLFVLFENFSKTGTDAKSAAREKRLSILQISTQKTSFPVKEPAFYTPFENSPTSSEKLRTRV